MGKIVDNIFSGAANLIGLGGKSPKVDTAPATNLLDETTKKAKKTRTQALSTVGGVSGVELSPSQISQGGGTLFGN